MESTLPAEQLASYTAIIDAILAGSDLETISAKKIRKEMQQSITYDINPQKEAINNLIHQRFDKVSADRAAAAAPPPPPAPTAAPVATPKTNGSTSLPASSLPLKRPSPPSADEDEKDHVADLPSASSPPPKKKHKKTVSAEDSDAMLAAKLQAEEDSRRSRTTRGAANGETKPKKAVNGSAKKKKAKSRARVTSDDDDSTVESKREVNRTGGFHKPLGLQPPLAALLGETQLSRPQTVKKIWEYIKSRDLQDPSDKRVILCDDGLRGVFGKDKLQMFSMNKQLSTMLYALDE